MVFSKRNKNVQALVRARMNRIALQKSRKEDKRLRAEQKELRNYLLTNKEKRWEDRVKPGDVVNLVEDDSPFLWTYGGVLWRGLKNSWTGYKIGRKYGELGGDVEEQRRQRECAVKIQTFQELLRVDVDDFSRIGISKDYKEGDYRGEDI
jgi:hypothetical protein